MEEIDVKHIHVLEFPKQLLWTDRDLDYFLEEMPSEARRMNNDIYDTLIKEVKAGKDYSFEEAFNLAYYECVRISFAKYPESKDIFDVLEMDIQHNQNHVDYGFTDLIMNMVWAMLHSTGTAQRFADKLHSYLDNSKKLKFWFREFFTPNDTIHMIYPYKEKEEPRYNLKFIPCPKDMNYNSTNGEWCKLTNGYKEHLIEELLMLWPKDKRVYIRNCIMSEKAGQMNDFADYVIKEEIHRQSPKREKSQFQIDTELQLQHQNEMEQLRKECDEWKAKYAVLENTLKTRTDELNKLHFMYEEETKRTVMVTSLEEELDRCKKRCEELESKIEPEKAFNAQTGTPCFTNRQMGILLTAVGRITEKENPPGKTTLGEIVEKIAGYKSTTAGTNMKGAIPKEDTEAVATAIENKFPNLATEVRKLAL